MSLSAQLELVKQGIEHLILVLSKKDRMNADKLIPVESFLPLRFVDVVRIRLTFDGYLCIR